jgi:hypothetical protein
VTARLAETDHELSDQLTKTIDMLHERGHLDAADIVSMLASAVVFGDSPMLAALTKAANGGFRETRASRAFALCVRTIDGHRREKKPQSDVTTAVLLTHLWEGSLGRAPNDAAALRNDTTGLARLIDDDPKKFARNVYRALGYVKPRPDNLGNAAIKRGSRAHARKKTKKETSP